MFILLKAPTPIEVIKVWNDIDRVEIKVRDTWKLLTREGDWSIYVD